MYASGVVAVWSAEKNSSDKKLAGLLVDAREVGSEILHEVSRFGLR